MTKPQKKDDMTRISNAWWKWLLDLDLAIAKLGVSEAKQQKVLKRMYQLIAAFEAALYRAPNLLKEDLIFLKDDLISTRRAIKRAVRK